MTENRDQGEVFDEFSCSLLLLIGLPGSGKSTFARSFPDSVLISTDAIRAQLFGDEATQGPWLKVWLEVRSQFQAAVQRIRRGEAAIALYDATNAARKQRRSAIALARHCGFTRIIGVWIQVPVEICIERNQNRDRQVPVAVILRMNRCLQGAPPSCKEDLDGLMELTWL